MGTMVGERAQKTQAPLSDTDLLLAGPPPPLSPPPLTLTRAPPPLPPSPPPAIEVEELPAPPPPAGTPPDRSPPVISMNGEPVVRVRVYRPYADAGASAVDDRDGPLAVAVHGLPIDTTQVRDVTHGHSNICTRF